MPRKTKPVPMAACEMPLMQAQCSTCPFRPEGDRRVRASVEARIYTSASQICHHPQLHGKNGTHLCRGARDEQLKIFHRLGVIAEPTDAAWAEAWAKLKPEA
jgi:hypothetical protein